MLIALRVHGGECRAQRGVVGCEVDAGRAVVLRNGGDRACVEERAEREDALVASEELLWRAGRAGPRRRVVCLQSDIEPALSVRLADW